MLGACAVPLPTIEPRGAVCASLRVAGQMVRVVGMHLDLSGLWRRRQAHSILAHVDASVTRRPTVLMGDLNEWRTGPNSPLSPFLRADVAGASNAWAAAPTRSAAGGTLLANDPHLGFTAPTLWYLARLELQSGGVIGATIPGVPLVLSGRSDKFGWGVTASYADDLDVVIEKLNPGNTEQYQTPDGWKDFVTLEGLRH